MNLSGIGANLQSQAQGGSTRISEEQSAKLQDILSNYDPEALTAESAEKIVQQIKELGIRPGQELAQELEAAGFDPRELREAAGVGDRRPPPPPPSDLAQQQALNVLSDVLEGYDLSALSEGDKSDIAASLAERGVTLSYKNNVVDITA